MKSKENLVFLGMMAAGKSSIGSLVAKKLKLNFTDIDLEIEKISGKSINKIFQTKGEKSFRELEEKITLKKLNLSSSVISLGGGAFMNKKIRTEILNNHVSIWLKLDNKTLIKRIRNSLRRPIAARSTNEELIDLIKIRTHIYSKALYKVNCDNLTKTEAVGGAVSLTNTDFSGIAKWTLAPIILEISLIERANSISWVCFIFMNSTERLVPIGISLRLSYPSGTEDGKPSAANSILEL